MIMATILLILIPLLLSLIILFSFYIFLPSLDAGNLDKDAIISEREKTFHSQPDAARETFLRMEPEQGLQSKASRQNKYQVKHTKTLTLELSVV